jgi:glycosyltransferase involved in cell wall biosynthesis
MKNLEDLYIISNDRFYKNRFSNHNDLASILEAFEKKYNIKIIARSTKVKLKFLTIKKKINFLDFFLIKTFKHIKSLNRKTKFLFISLTPFNTLVFLFLRIFFNNFYLYLRSDGFNEYKIILGRLGALFYYVMLTIVINNVKLIISSKNLNFKNSFFYLVRPSELTKLWFKNVKKNNINNNNLRLLYLGRYRKEKGINDFIQLISSSKLSFHMKVYGIDHSNSSFINSEKVTYLPQITNVNKIIKAYDDCNIFILPSYTESSPKVIWESLARSRPVIVFEEISHVAKGKIGVYVCKRNLNSLIETIEFIIKNYKFIQINIKKNKFPLKKQFKQKLIDILK